MFSFNTLNYEFMTFNPKRIEHVKAKCFLVTNPEVRKYLNDTIDKNLNPKNNNAYLVSRDDRIVGYLGVFDLRDYLELHYAVVGSYRGYKFSLTETTGCQILKEASENLFERYKSIEFIKLDIETSNIRSKKAALAAGYYPYGVDDLNCEEYRRYR
ncbi:MAG: hypothetical protein MR765_05015 [Tenericutes bacterium]|nr:hypothetical protein [Mycoplasmatota bacterium]